MPEETVVPAWLHNTVMREFAQRPGVQKTKLVEQFVNDILDIVLNLPNACLHAECMPKEDYDDYGDLAREAERQDQELDDLRARIEELEREITLRDNQP